MNPIRAKLCESGGCDDIPFDIGDVVHFMDDKNHHSAETKWLFVSSEILQTSLEDEQMHPFVEH